MSRNLLKIVCNPGKEDLSYFFRNELNEWIELSSSSPLSRSYFKYTSMDQRGHEIVKKADEVYNRNNRGLDIIFEGDDTSFEFLKGAVNAFLYDRDVRCIKKITRIAVAGKNCAGKTTLLEGIQKYLNTTFTKDSSKASYEGYIDKKNNTQWYEVADLTFRRNSYQEALSKINQLAPIGLTTVVYCISCASNRVEQTELDFIFKIREIYSDVKVIVALTQSYSDDYGEMRDIVEVLTDHIKVIPVLAKPISFRGGRVIQPSGLDELCKCVYEKGTFASPSSAKL